MQTKGNASAYVNENTEIHGENKRDDTERRHSQDAKVYEGIENTRRQRGELIRIQVSGYDKNTAEMSQLCAKLGCLCIYREKY